MTKRERKNLNARLTYHENREERLAKAKAARAAYPERERQHHARNREQRNAYSREYRLFLRHQIITGYGGRCVHCGDARKEVLTFDHTFGDGARHRKEIGKGSTRVLRWIVSTQFAPDVIRLLCYNCNYCLAHRKRLPDLNREMIWDAPAVPLGQGVG